MTPDQPLELSPDLVDFWSERHLCSVTTLRADGSPHVVPMGIALDAEHGLAWGITSGASQKAANLRRGDRRVAVCQVDGRRWLTLQGPVHVERDAESVADAVERYAQRYRQPRVNPERVVLVIEVERILGHG